jgi:hypothetical protein
MIVYNYHPDTGVFLNTSTEADPDPLDPGNWLIPANATPLVPPSPPDPKKQHAVFRDEAWLVENIPLPPAIHANYKEAPVDGLWPHISIKEALKGGVT